MKNARPLGYAPIGYAAIARRRSTALGILMVAATSACSAGIDSAVFMSAPPVATPTDIRIYRTQVPPCEHEELGVVTWQPTVGWQKLQTGVEKMRARAAEMGGHAIIGFNIGHTAGTTTTIRTDSTAVVDTSVNTDTRMSGTVIRFRTTCSAVGETPT